jgi:uncharacterized protein
MARLMIAVALTAAALSLPARAEDDAGSLNPEEMTLDYFANRYDFKAGKSAACMYGYAATKSGNHVAGQKIFQKCIDAGVDAALIWKSYMSDNGYGTRKSFEDAAAWDKKAADRGYKVGEYNYGLSLLRGHGVAMDEAAGRQWIGRAAAQGDLAAKTLIESGYDLDVAVPDADEPRGY